MWKQAINFFTNSSADSAKTPVKAPALSITKVGVAAMFLWTFLSGMAGLVEPLNHSNGAVIAGSFDLARIGLFVAGAIAVADIVVRGLPAIFKANQADRDG